MEHKRLDSVLINDICPPKESGYITATPLLGPPRNNTVHVLSIIRNSMNILSRKVRRKFRNAF